MRTRSRRRRKNRRACALSLKYGDVFLKWGAVVFRNSGCEEEDTGEASGTRRDESGGEGGKGRTRAGLAVPPGMRRAGRRGAGGGGKFFLVSTPRGTGLALAACQIAARNSRLGGGARNSDVLRNSANAPGVPNAIPMPPVGTLDQRDPRFAKSANSPENPAIFSLPISAGIQQQKQPIPIDSLLLLAINPAHSLGRLKFCWMCFNDEIALAV